MRRSPDRAVRHRRRRPVGPESRTRAPAELTIHRGDIPQPEPRAQGTGTASHLHRGSQERLRITARGRGGRTVRVVAVAQIR
ncbi:hypothetical protein [Thermobispora bispora]|uniref:Uncharacterized protein n=1 Tax=Thermobispora bispora (strain ATCC 19993 / DSM 43833 / CBS 139.67 / JCM 10125 / KCTC 9307 / NBRC 14880 / R51) TaxID=469371 RepID=D6YBE0_THEBD|nr:hypothetical protein [Thermobispora bispora]ADG88500.1 hypothetical protein Tbis_1788 [Thermobispora bispora DSM 43833]